MMSDFYIFTFYLSVYLYLSKMNIDFFKKNLKKESFGNEAGDGLKHLLNGKHI